VAQRRRRTGVVAIVSVAVGVTVVWLTAFQASPPAAHGGTPGAVAALAGAARALPRRQKPAFSVGRPVELPPAERTARFAPVLQAAIARQAPAPMAAEVAPLATQTPESTTNLVLVLDEVTRPTGEWVHIRLPVLPNDRTAWVPRSVLGGYHFVHTRLVVDRQRLTATLYDRGEPVFRAPVGIGRSASPTPGGRFYVRDRLSGFGNTFYGPVAFGTSARSAVLTDWPGGGFVGIHGTNQPGLIPGRVSHGCVRLRNSDIVRLARLMPVGTPVTIE
jgi:lipoprotein-anchoring transpeptidase ErfK/SrfK